MQRSCGDCQLCCKLLPVQEIRKLSGDRCKHQAHRVGCRVYGNPRAMPLSCRVWNCVWLVSPEAADLRRPDRSHYVIDVMPDFITITMPDSVAVKLPVIQVWVDTGYPDAHKDPALRSYLEAKQAAALVRYNNNTAFTIFPPSLTPNGKWLETPVQGNLQHQHSVDEIFEVMHQ